MKTARNKDGAIKFLEHLVSSEAQEIFANRNNEYPVLNSMALDPVLAGFTERAKFDTAKADEFGRNNRKALEIMNRANWK